MVTKEIIKSELDKVPEGRLEEIYEVVKLYSRPGTQSNGGQPLVQIKEYHHRWTGRLCRER